MKYVRGILAIMIFASSVFAAEEAPQMFTLDGRLYSDATGTNPLLDSNVTLVFQILNDDETCILYEETRTGFNSSVSNGYFNLQIGSEVGAVKRSSNDSGNSMAAIYSNTSALIPGKRVSDGTACTPTPQAGDQRFVRIQVTPSSGGTRTLTPNMALDSVPSAIIAERAETLRGLVPSQLLQVNTTAGQALSQSNVENIFTTSNYNLLLALLNGTSTLYTKPAANGTIAIPNLTSTPPATPAAGQIWYDAGVIKYYDGVSSSIKTISTGTSTQVAAGSGTAGAPSISFAGDTDTGWYSPLANTLAAATGGAERVRIDSSGNMGVATADPTFGTAYGANETVVGVTGKNDSTNSIGRFVLANNRPTATNLDYTGFIDFVSVNNPGSERRSAGIGSMLSGAGGASGYGGDLRFYTKQDNGTYTQKMIVTPSGSVGIGTTNPGFPVQISHSGDNVGALTVGDATTIASTTGLYLRSTTEGRITTASTGSMTFYTGSPSMERMRVLSSGNVGIGTTAPGRLLHINGPMRVQPAALPGTPATGDIAVDSGDSNKLKYYNGSAWLELGAGSGGSFTNVSNISNTAGDITLAPQVTTGKVAVTSGTSSTSSTTGALVVTGGLGVSENVNVGGNVAASNLIANTKLTTPQIYGSTAASGTLKLDGTSNVFKGDVLINSAGGNVGIGTTTPGTALDVRSSGTSVEAIQVTNSAGFSVATLGTTGTNAGQLILKSATGTQTGVINGNPSGSSNLPGSLGVGTSSNSSQLTVKGTTTDNTASALNVTDSATASKLFVRNDGAVGIGTTVPKGRFDIADGNLAMVLGADNGVGVSTRTDGTAKVARVGVYPGTNADLPNTVYFGQSSAGGFGSLAIGGGSSLMNTMNSVSIYTGPANTTIGSPRVTVDSTGNVGIGTTAPTGLLQTNTTGATENAVIQTSTTGGSAFKQVTSGGANTIQQFKSRAGYTPVVGGDQLGGWQYYGADATATPVLRQAGEIMVYADGTVTAGAVPGMMTFNTASSAGTLTERMRINSAGNVGIGTSTPANLLQVVDNTAGFTTPASFLAPNLPDSTSMKIAIGRANAAQGSGLLTYYHNNASANRRFSIGNQEFPSAITIGASGLVGIGTAAPARALHVTGPMRIDATALPGTPATGDIAVDSGDSNKLKYYNGSAWLELGAGSGGSFSNVSNISNSTGDVTIAAQTTTGKVAITSGTPSSSTTTGALVVTGGAGVSGNLFVGGTINSNTSVNAYNFNAISTGTFNPLTSYRSSSGVDEKYWDFFHQANSFSLRAVNDAYTVSNNAIVFNRTGNTITSTYIPTGNVGIGTTVPGYPLDVSIPDGSAGYVMRATATTGVSAIAIQSSAGNSGHLVYRKNGVGGTRWNAGINGFTESGSNVGSDYQISSFDDTGTALAIPFFIKRSTGNVGIGTTNPLAKFQIGDATTSTASPSEGVVRITGSNGVTGNWRYWDFKVGATSTATSAVNTHRLRLENNGTEVMTVDTSGNVGIGTTSPVGKLQLGETSSTQATETSLRLAGSNGATGNFNAWDFKVGATSTAGTAFNTERLRLFSNNSEVLTVSSAGNLGIGTTAPARALHVTGPIRIDATALPSTPVIGDIAIDSGDGNKFKYYNGSSWIALMSGGSGSFTNVTSISNSAGNITLSPVTTSGAVVIDSGTSSFSTGSGALRVTGGVGITENLNVGGNTQIGGAVDIGNTVTIHSQSGLAYSSTSSSVNAPSGMGVATANDINSDGAFSGYQASARNTANTYQSGYMGVVSNPSGYTPTMVFGRQTGATAYTESMRISSSGNVGIGTTNPSSRLHVVGPNSGGYPMTIQAAPGLGPAAYMNLALNNTTSGAYKSSIDFQNSGSNKFSLGVDYLGNGTNNFGLFDNVAGVHRFFVDASGNMGIGTTAPTAKLDVVGGDVSIRGPDSNYVQQSLSTYSSGAAWHSPFLVLNRARGTAAAPTYPLSGDQLGLIGLRNQGNTSGAEIVAFASENQSASTGGTNLNFKTTASGSTSPVDRMVIDSAGSVGVGTTNPTAIFEINKGQNGTPVLLNLSNSQTPAANVGGVIAWGNGGNSSARIKGFWTAVNNGALTFETKQASTMTEAMRIDNAGNVGIGTTAPAYKLDINGVLNATGIKIAGVDINSGTNYINQTTQVAYASAYTPTSGSAASPLGAASIINNTDTTVGTGSYVQLQTGNANRTSYIGSVHGGTGVTPSLVFGSQTGASAYSERMRIDGSGNLGIGTTAPTTILHAKGSSPALTLEDSVSSGAFTYTQQGANQGVIRTNAPSGAIVLDINPTAADGTSASNVRLFRNTNTTGARSFQVLRGDNTTTVDAQISAGTSANTFFAANGGNVGIGTTAPSSILSFNGDANRTIGMERASATQGRSLTLSGGGAPVGATDSPGGDVVLSTGTATGTGGGQIYFKTSGGGSSGTADSLPISQMVLSSSGRLGIGNGVTPFSKLDVGGNVSIGSYAGTAAAPANGMIVSGNVGIGTSAPSGALDVNGNSTRVQAILRNTNATSKKSELVWSRPDLATTLGWYAGTDAAQTGGDNFYIWGGNGGGGGYRIFVDTNGKVGMGTTTPSEVLEVNGSVRATSFISSSDIRLKRDVASAGGLDIVTQLTGVDWIWKSTGQPDSGVIAQDVEKVLPNAVVTDPNTGLKAVKYNALFAPIIQSIKELYYRLVGVEAKVDRAVASLKAENEKLKADNAAKEKEMAELKARMDRIEKMLAPKTKARKK